MSFRKLSHEPDVTFQPGAGGENTVRIDETILYQQMEGFGAAMTDSSVAVDESPARGQTPGSDEQPVHPRGRRYWPEFYVRIPMVPDFAQRLIIFTMTCPKAEPIQPGRVFGQL